jgi:hypothetical protein
MIRCLGAWTLLLTVMSAAVSWDQQQAQESSAKEQLAKVQGLVGAWRGVGQPQRGSTRGSWIEAADWAWKFSADGPALVANLEGGKYFSAVALRPGDKPDEFTLTAKSADGQTELRYRGTRDPEGKLTLAADKPPAEMPARITIRLVAGGDRLLVLLERTSPAARDYVRLAEVGYTRKGSGFGKGAGGPECIVTGGFGSIEVVYKGQKYYVCCTGCRDYFSEHPEEVLAEYKARKEAEKKTRGEGKKTSN